MEFPHLGKHCALEECHQLDFLPFKCTYCKELFCSDHWKVDTHHCPKYNANKNIAINCPICGIVVPIREGDDPNLKMDDHITRECGMKKQSKVCQAKKCQTYLIQPISCLTCGGEFCPRHRFPSDHQCQDLSPNIHISKSSNKSQSNKTQKIVIKESTTKNINNKSTITNDLKHAAAKPFVQVTMNRRAKSERKSQIKALRDREQRGILSDRDKVVLAELMAEDAKQVKETNKDGCIIV